MTSEEAYRVVRNVLSKDLDKQILESRYDADIFGNFLISFIGANHEMSIVHDMGQLFVCDNPSGTEDCKMLIAPLFNIGERELRQALRGREL